MPLHRRSLLLTAPALALAHALPARAEDDPRLAPRFVGKADAPVTVTEWFSLTCPHCARFARDTLPRIHSELIDTGKLLYGYGDFPLDQVALLAAMVARALPPERYEPFVLALLSSQDRWAFARGINSTDEIAKMAALAGMSRATFDATIADTKLREAILSAQDNAQKTFKVDSTPTFLFRPTLATSNLPPAAVPTNASVPTTNADGKAGLGNPNAGLGVGQSEGFFTRLEHTVLNWFGFDEHKSGAVESESAGSASPQLPAPVEAKAPPAIAPVQATPRTIQKSGELSFEVFTQAVQDTLGTPG